MKHVLVVGVDDPRLATLARALGEGVELHRTLSTPGALEQLRLIPDTALLLTPALEQDIDGFQILLAAREQAPQVRAIVLTDLDDAAGLAELSAQCVVHYVAAESEPEAVGELARAIVAGEVQAAGTLGSLELLDIVVLACLCQRSAVLHVHHGADKGKIIFDHGDIAHASFRALLGPDALFELLALPQGDVFMQNRLEDYVRTVDKPWARLLGEGLAEIDRRRVEIATRAAARHSIDEGDVAALLGIEENEVQRGPASSVFFSQDEIRELEDLEEAVHAPSVVEPLHTPHAMRLPAAHFEAEPQSEDLDTAHVRLEAHASPFEPTHTRRFEAPSLATSTSRASMAELNRYAPESLADDLPSLGATRQPSQPTLAAMSHHPLSHHPLSQGTNPASEDYSRDEAHLYDVLERLQYEVPEFVATQILHLVDGLDVASLDAAGSFDSATAAAFYSELLHASRRAVRGYGLLGDIEECVIALQGHYMLLRTLRGTPFVHMLLMGRQGNLGIARVVMRQAEPQLLRSLPH